jgi:endonuclease YncB( thermonuclease family)
VGRAGVTAVKCFTALIAVFLLAPLPALAQEVPQVVDGDTLKFGHQRVRLYGIDAPELHQTCDGGTWAAGKLARAALMGIIGGRPVTCVVIVPRDRYGRPVSTCSAGKMDLAYAMAERGWAWAFTRYTDKYVGQEETAAAHHLGLHGHACAVAWEWRAARLKAGN